MSQTLLINPTAMEAGLITAARARQSAGAAQQAAFERFSRTGLPNRRMEVWRWSDFRVALRKKPPAPPPAKVLASSPFAELNPIEIRIVNGAPEIVAGDQAGGLRIEHRAPAGATEYLDDHPIVSLNVALACTALAIVIEDGAAIERPILIRHIATGGEAFSQVLVKIGDGAEAVIIESYEGYDAAFLSGVTHISVGARAKFTRYLLQAGSDASVMNGVGAIMAGASAHIDQTALAFGGALARLETHILHTGPDAVSNLAGTAMLSEKRHADFTSGVHYAAPGCASRQIHKAALRDQARGVFQGKFRVKRAGQKTDAQMTANALLLSDGAEANHKPELEIYADDIQCAHGSTVGALDEDALFYLRTRGLDEQAARALLIEAFLGEVLEDVAHQGVRGVFHDHMNAWLELGGAP